MLIPHRSTGLLVVLALAVSAVVASPLLVESAIPGGTVTDPQGDASGGGPDIASFSVCYTATELQLALTSLFSPITPFPMVPKTITLSSTSSMVISR